MNRRLAAALLALGLLVTGAAVLVVLTSDHEDSKLATLVLNAPGGLAFVVGGVIAWARRPENRIGRLMVLTGFTWFLGALTAANHPYVFTVGVVVSTVTFGFFVALVLSFPSGRLRSRLDRILVGATFVLSTVGNLGYLFVADLSECQDCPRNVLLVADLDAAATAIEAVIRALALAITLTLAVILVRRWSRATPAVRRALTPVLLTAALAAFLFGLAVALQPFSESAAEAFDWVSIVAFLGVPLAFLFGLLRSRLARVGAARTLLEGVPDEPSVGEAEEGLRRALRDPTLELAYWAPESGGYVDRDGDPFELPEDSRRRVTTKIEYEGRPLAALVHDAMLLDEPELLADVLATARLALERDRSLRALRATERRGRALLDAIPDNMFRITREGGYLDASIKDERYLPVPSAQLPGTTIHDVLPPEVALVIQSAVGRALDTGEVQTVEYRMQRPVGVRDSEARIVAAGEDEAVIIVRDITERKAAETELRQLHDELEVRAEELQRERDLLGTVVNTAPAFFCGVDPEGRIVRFNTALQLLSGRIDDESTRGQRFWDVFVVPDERGAFEDRFRDAIQGPAKLEHENTWVTEKGEPAVVAWSAAWYPGEGGADRFLISGTDVTERHAHAAELERERNFLNAIANNAPSLLCLVDAEGRVADRATNVAFEQTLDYKTSETGGYVFWERYVHPDDTEVVRDRIERIVAGEQLGEHDSRWVSRNGRTFLIAWSCTPLPRIDERRLFLVSGIDITQRKRQEEEIRKSRSRIVEAGDLERRRLERNLHDGAQQRLISLSLSLRRALTKLRSDPDAAERILGEAGGELTFALEELRELARGIHPAVLTDRGLGPALESLALRAPIQVDLEQLPEERLPGPVEAAAFYVVSEALTNVAKYAQASAARVRIERGDGSALVEVADDGVGGADPARGTGLRGLADRVEALEGRLEVDSAPGRGTVVRAEIPVS